MKTRGLLISSLVVAGAMVAFAFLSAQRLPAGQELAIHWNLVGEADGFAPALQALLFPAGMVVFLAALFAAIPRLEPMQDRLDKSAPVLRTVWIGVTAMMVAVQAMIALPAWGFEPSIKLVFVAVGVLLLTLGNVLPKSRPGFFVGIRTPWTLTNEDNWIATHRLGGKLTMLAGVVALVAALLPFSPEAIRLALFAAIGVAVIVPLVYSWWLWRSEKTSRG